MSQSKPFNWWMAIPSKSRPNSVKSSWLLPIGNARLIVHDREFDQYAASYGADMVRAVPDSVDGIGATRAEIMRITESEGFDFVFMVDDDIRAVYNMFTLQCRKIKNVDTVRAIIENTAQLADDLGIGFFGFHPTCVSMERCSQLPYSFRRFVNVAHGSFAGKVVFDPNLRDCEDIDALLNEFKERRVALVNNRYGSSSERWSPGGCVDSRSSVQFEKTRAYLDAKWGRGVVTFSGSRRQAGRSVKINI